MAEAIQTTTRAMLTKYSKIYENVYWGWCRLNGDKILQDSASYSTPEIIENRNRFIEEHRIKRFFKISGRFVNTEFLWRPLRSCNQHRMFDHKECYLTKENTIIILVSPYNDPYNDSMHYQILAYGFKKTYPMYGNGATSYYMEIPNKLNEKYLKTVELEKYWGKRIYELIKPKKGFLYWMRTMRYEQKFMMINYDRGEHDVFEREDDIISDYMHSLLSYMLRSGDQEVNRDNLYEFHKYLDSIHHNCWVYAVQKTM